MDSEVSFVAMKICTALVCHILGKFVNILLFGCFFISRRVGEWADITAVCSFVTVTIGIMVDIIVGKRRNRNR